MNSLYGWLGILWIAFWISVAQGSVGQMSEPAEIYPWYMPLIMAAFLIPPFILGFLSGRGK